MVEKDGYRIPIIDAVLSMPATYPPHLAKIVLDRAYDRYTQIHHHQSDDNPLSIVSLHESEDAATGGLYKAYLLRFMRLGVHKRLGVSINDVMDYPIDYVEELLRVVLAMSQETQSAEEELREELKEKYEE